MALKTKEWVVFKDKVVLITGVCGTVGSELFRNLLKKSDDRPVRVIGIDNNESELFFLDQAFRAEERASLLVADITNEKQVSRIMKGVDIVLHGAAFKHVILCETMPSAAVSNNIQGLQNLIYAAQQENIERFIFMSSDKAVNPTNVMGTTKLLGERLVTAGNDGACRTIFSSTRFGNILGSNGSVLQIFEKQIREGSPLTITSRGMTRFVMTVQDAAELVLKSATIAKAGDVVITKMPIMRIEDLASACVEKLSTQAAQYPIEIIGAKPGEKLFEELMSDEETKRAIELADYFIVKSVFSSQSTQDLHSEYDVINDRVVKPYNSSVEESMNKQSVYTYLIERELI